MRFYNLDEVKKFSRLAEDWWREQGAMKPLHKINFPRSLFIDTHCSLGGKKLADIGCGGGIFAEAMAERGAKVTAIDPSAELIEVARQHSKEKKLKIDYRVGTTEQLLARHKQTFDLVSCLEVLEHTANPAQLIGQCAALLKKGGWGYFSTINRTMKAYFLTILGAEYLLGWLPKGTHSYDSFIQPAELSGWLEQEGMATKFIRGINYDPLSNKFLLGNSVAINYLLLAQKE